MGNFAENLNLGNRVRPPPLAPTHSLVSVKNKDEHAPASAKFTQHYTPIPCLIKYLLCRGGDYSLLHKPAFHLFTKFGFSPQLSPCLQPQSKSYPQPLPPERKWLFFFLGRRGSRIGVHGSRS